MIQLVDFSKRYSQKSDFAVKNVNLSAKTGITALLGLNGAGKSTIIKAICAEHYATSGEVFVSPDDKDFLKSKINVKMFPENAKKIIGYVSEVENLLENLTVCEYLKIIQNIYPPVESCECDFFSKTVSDWELEDVLSKKISFLSKGFRQRVSFAAALIHNPKNIVLDEPINGLDPAQIIQFRKIVKQLAKTKTILISTHLMQEVHSLADKIYIISEKTVKASGSEEELILQSGEKDIESAFLKITGGIESE